MQTEQIEMLKPAVEFILLEAKALNPLVIDQIHVERTIFFKNTPSFRTKRTQ